MPEREGDEFEADRAALGGGRRRAALRVSPAGSAVLGYLLVILLGGALFRLPFMTEGEGLGWIDALFLSASAACVTGLSPVADLPGALSFPGEVLLLGLLQLGGIGVVLIAVLLVRAIGRRVGTRHSLALADSYGEGSGRSLDLLRHVIVTTLAFEALGAALLWWRWRELPEGAWHSLFHSVSAFCNAGFSTFPGGLAEQRSDRVACTIVLVLLVIGGLGFHVVAEVIRWLRRRRRKPFVLSLHSRIVLTSSMLLLAGGALALTPALGGAASADASGSESFVGRAFDALFHSASARTAGFNLIEIGDLGRPALLILCALMVIGASPGSTGGGMKTVTLVIYLRSVWAQVRGSADVTIRERALHEPQVRQAVALVTVYGLALLALVFAMTVFTGASESEPAFAAILFESCSALGTVGLSTGLTTELGGAGKIALAVAMLAGRVGPITLVYFLGGGAPRSPLRYPRERVFLG